MVHDVLGRTRNGRSALSSHIATIWHLLMNNDIVGIDVDMRARTDGCLHLTDATGHTLYRMSILCGTAAQRLLSSLPGLDLLSGMGLRKRRNVLEV